MADVFRSSINACLPIVVALLSLMVCGGCAISQAPHSEQERSFEPYEEIRLGGEHFRTHALLRTALVFSGDQLDLKEFHNNPPSVEGDDATLSAKVKFKPGVEDLSVGSAAAIDRRGYFVTAAHCIEEGGKQGGVYLAFSDSRDGFVLKRARVVWSGRAEFSDGTDFAVLKVVGPLRLVFKWGATPVAGDAVVGTGASKEKKSGTYIPIRPFAGKVISTHERKESGFRGLLIYHDLPLRKGNSGGPLINSEGKLVGVSFAKCISLENVLLWRKRCGSAIRPDLDWLADLIDQDYASLQKKR